MKKIFLLISIIILITSCVSSKEFQVPMTEKMYQESKLEAKLIRKSKKKNFLKNYTKNFVNSIPDKDLKLITKDTIIVVYDTTTVR
jgi:hypothetical protein